MDILGLDADKAIDWASPRLTCIAGDFKKYDEHAVTQINRNIELMRYRRYGEDYLILELVNAVTSSTSSDSGTPAGKPKTKTVTDYLNQAPTELRNLYQATDEEAALVAARTPPTPTRPKCGRSS